MTNKDLNRYEFLVMEETLGIEDSRHGLSKKEEEELKSLKATIEGELEKGENKERQ